MSVKFYLVPKPLKTGECPVRASIVINNVRLLTTLGFSVSPDAWVQIKVQDKIVSCKVKSKYTNSNGLTAEQINSTLKGIDAHFSQYKNNIKSKRPTVDDLRAELQRVLGKEQVDSAIDKPIAKIKSTFDILDEFVLEQGAINQWTYSTNQCWKTFSHHLAAFNNKVKLDDFDESGIIKFIRFLRTTEKLEEKTAQKQYKLLKWFLTWAIRKGYTKQDHIIKYKAKFKVLQKPVIFLTKEELLKVSQYEIPANQTEITLRKPDGSEYKKIVQEAGAIAKTRDLFCFCAFTSLRYSDMAKLKRTDIADGKIYITTKKTNDRLPIELNSFAQAILDKYKDFKFQGGLALPVISNQKMNFYLKDLCELCEINEPITKVFYRAGERVEETLPKYEYIGTHAGRRTFICFALASGIPPQVVMKWTGHSDYKAMKPYIDIAEKTKAEQMAIFESCLKG